MGRLHQAAGAMADHQATVMPEAHHKHHEFIGAHHGVVLRVAP